MSLALTSAIIAGLAAVGSAIFGYAGQQDTNRRIDETNKKNLDLQMQAWAREDNAVQRRKADLEAAGLSPTLAAGSAAAASSPSFQFKNTTSGLDKLGAMMDAPSDAINAYMDMQSKETNLKADKANAKIASNNATISDDTKALQISNMTEEAAILKAESKSAAIDAQIKEIQRQEALNEKDRIPQKNRVQDLVIQQMEQDILNGNWERAMKISSHFADMLKTGFEMSNQAERNTILKQHLLQSSFNKK